MANYCTFFLFAGINIEVEHISENQKLIMLYIVLRIVSRILGAVLGARLGGENFHFGKWLGMALMPQAGVALGMALTAAHRFEEFESIISVIAATTVFFEVVGPVCTRFALKKMDNINKGAGQSSSQQECSF